MPVSGRNDIMVDIETLGSAPGCVITQIGVVLFDPMSAPGSRIGSGLQVNVDVDDAMRFGLKVSGETLRWWFTEPTQHARERAIASRDIQLPSDVRALPLVEALSSVRSYCAEAKRVWSHGAAFDIPIIDAACSAAGVAPCWEGHRTARDTRTLYDMLPGGTGRPPVIDARKLLTSHTLVPHRALDDALVQAVEVQEAFRLLREKETK
jgi:hypothetical protein